MDYNRPDILNSLIHRINSFSEGYRQNIAIIGEPHIGKTTIIKNLLSSDKIKKETIIPIYLEVKTEPFEYCAKRFIKAVLFQILPLDKSLTSLNDTAILVEDLKKIYPKTANLCARVLQDIEKNRLDEAYSFMLDIPAIISEEYQKRCILILDEFHNIADFSIKNPFGTLAKKIMIQKDTMYLLVSSRHTVSLRILNEKLSMLFGNFEKILLPPFDIPLSRTFLRDNIHAITLPNVYLDFIASFTGNKPFYMLKICDEIKKVISFKNVDPDDHLKLMETTLVETIFKKTGVINQHFSNFLSNISDGRLRSRSAAILIALSSENRKQHDIAKSARLPIRDASKILSRLVEMDIVTRNGSLYRINDKLFCFWINSGYLKRIMSFSIDESVEETSFRKDVIDKLGFFLQEYEKDICSRIIELFSLFKNDVIQLNGKTHKFLVFNDVKKIEGTGNSTNIIAISDKFRWLCTIKREYIDENDVVELINTVKGKKQNNINRNILIPLAGINENAYLLAKETKFWIWDLHSLNVLMELYGKPHICYNE